MAKRKTPPRYKSGPKKGQFMPTRKTRKRRTRRNPTRSRSRSTPRRARSRAVNAARDSRGRFVRTARGARTNRRSYRANPVRPDIVRQFTDGAITATQVLVGKAAVRSVPDMFALPKQGNVGIAIQAGTALALGFVADMFFSRDTSRAIVAGGLTAPLETLVVAYDVPWLGRALSPVSQNGDLGAYVSPAAIGNGGNMSAGVVVHRNPGRTVMRRGLGRYAQAGGIYPN